jgi:putative endonuclease
MKRSYVYIMANFKRNVTYIGVCNDLVKRVSQHKNGEGGYWTSKYKCYYLVYFEEFNDIKFAIERETKLKNWHSDWKYNLIKESNPDMKDLSDGWYT